MVYVDKIIVAWGLQALSKIKKNVKNVKRFM